jgi:hypothetical protein
MSNGQTVKKNLIAMIDEDFIQSYASQFIERELKEQEMNKLRHGSFWDSDDVRFLMYEAIEKAILYAIEE